MVDKEMAAKYFFPFEKESFRKKLKKIKVIYTDVDATLLGPRASFFTSPSGGYTLTAAKNLIRALEKGLDITLISGRSSRQLLSDARILGLKNFIAELGGEIVYDLGKESYFQEFSLPWEGDTPHQAIVNSGAVDFLFEVYKGRLEHHTPWSEGRRCTLVFRGWLNLEEANSLLKKEGYESLELLDNGAISSRGTLNPALPEVHAYHLVPAGLSKGKAVAKDRQIRGLAKEEAVAIGDSPSDLDIASEVELFFVVKNGVERHPEMLEALEEKNNVFVTREPMNLGFAEVIELILSQLET